MAKAQEPRGCLKRLSDTVRHVFNIANVTNPEDEGAIDHMVSVTTAMKSPFIAVACHTVSNYAPDPGLISPIHHETASHDIQLTPPHLQKQTF